jgi:hypothetical protein
VELPHRSIIIPGARNLRGSFDVQITEQTALTPVRKCDDVNNKNSAKKMYSSKVGYGSGLRSDKDL